MLYDSRKSAYIVVIIKLFYEYAVSLVTSELSFTNGISAPANIFAISAWRKNCAAKSVIAEALSFIEYQYAKIAVLSILRDNKAAIALLSF